MMTTDIKKGTPLDLSGMPASVLEESETNSWLRVVGVRFSETGRLVDFDAKELSLKLNDPVVVDDPVKGLRLGWVAKPPIRFDNDQLKLRLRRILRSANNQDLENYRQIEERERRGIETTQRAVNRMELPMKILRVESTLDRRKTTVYFASESRVDFRELLKELVHDLKSKVELRQIGVRDETKRTGAIGICGEELCCSRFLNRFHGVSIKMAKYQGLSLKPTKVTGMCGRLKCCLAYENDLYKDASRGVPPVGSCVRCSSGVCGVIQSTDVLRRLVTVEMEDGTIKIEPLDHILEVQTMKGQGGRRESSWDEEVSEEVASLDEEEVSEGVVEEMESEE